MASYKHLINNVKSGSRKSINLNDLIARAKVEKRKEKKKNLLLIAAAAGAVAISGIIISL